MAYVWRSWRRWWNGGAARPWNGNVVRPWNGSVVLPYAAAALLGLAAVVEVTARPVVDGTTSPLALALALASTVPVALVRAQPAVAAVLVAAATVFTFLVDLSPPVAAGAAVLLTLQQVAVRTARRARAEAVRRDAADRTIRATLLEHAARGERARIARELHDVVAHHISMIAVQAEAARLTIPGLPPEGATRLVAIGDTARSALTEMRRLLGVLREDAGDEPAEDARRPQPGLSQLNELLDEARGLVASARLIVRGRVAPLDPGVELTAYRIVQEALTNARRHAAGAAVDVDLDYREDALHLRVRDNGPGPARGIGTPPAGHGLAGMRERAAMAGGTLTTGEGPVGGFLVEAVLPRGGVAP
jgi:signal transduction histidine kinase